MIVVDASILANALADDEEDGAAARGELRQTDALTAPDLVDVETVAVLRRRWLAGAPPTNASLSPSRTWHGWTSTAYPPCG